MAVRATWSKIAQRDEFKRSSVCAGALGSTIYVFGGELQPRKPRDGHTYKVDLAGGESSAHTTKIPATKTGPSPRVGAATALLNGKIYLFSGRGGEDMSPINEKGHLWVLDTSTDAWTSLPPSSDVYPEPRSYHCLTSDGHDDIYLHAGCPSKGRLSDLWKFTLSTSEWTQLASAPEPARGGASIAYTDGKVYRMNGFDGKTEQGGNLDVYDPSSNSWTSTSFRADGVGGPQARSVAALVSVVQEGSKTLVTLFGEADPSSLGHQGAGKMLSDVWSYSLQNEKWSRIASGSQDVPAARGWFGADAIKIDGKDGIVVVGGLGEDNERLDNIWLLTFN